MFTEQVQRPLALQAALCLEKEKDFPPGIQALTAIEDFEHLLQASQTRPRRSNCQRGNRAARRRPSGAGLLDVPTGSLEDLGHLAFAQAVEGAFAAEEPVI